MLVYEKNNKLNINFENSVEETPDLQIGKEDGKTVISVDGQEQSSGSGSFPVTFTSVVVEEDVTVEVDKTFSEITDAYKNGLYVYGKFDDGSYFFNLDAVIDNHLTFMHIGVYSDILEIVNVEIYPDNTTSFGVSSYNLTQGGY